MPGSHPLSATFVWLIEIQFYCENQSSSMSHTRDIHSNRVCSSLITWGLVIGSGNKIACRRGQHTNLESNRVINSAKYEVSNPVK